MVDLPPLHDLYGYRSPPNIPTREAESEKTRPIFPQILQCFLEHGADTSAVVIAAVGDYEEAENLRIDTPSGFIYRELFYVEISQILQFLIPPSKSTQYGSSFAKIQGLS